MLANFIFMNACLYRYKVGQSIGRRHARDPRTEHIQNSLHPFVSVGGQPVIKWQVEPDQIWRNRRFSLRAGAHLRARSGKAAAVGLIIACQGIGQQCHIFQRAAKTANLIETIGGFQHPCPADHAPGGFKTKGAAEGCWPDHRPVGLRSNCQRHVAGRDGRGRAAGRAARAVLWIVRISGVIGVNKGQFGCHRFAHNHGPRFTQTLDQARIFIWLTIFENISPALGWHIAGIDDIFQTNGQTMQRPGAQPCFANAVAFCRLRQGALRVQIGPSVD